VSTATDERVSYPAPPADRRVTLEEARAYTERIARGHYENFSVVTAFFPRAKRQDMFNVYAFCRYSDDLGDEEMGQGDRVAALDAWDREIDAMLAGEPRHPILVALEDTTRRFAIPGKLYHDLVHAFRMDQKKTRFETFDEVRFYCRHSADPVGRLVLHVFEEAREETFLLSDETCTGLQLANFWQDVRRDLEIGRVYLPQETLRKFSYTEEDLKKGVCDDRWRSLLAFEVARARGFFERGLALLPLVNRALRVDLELFSRGGMAILDAIERRKFDVFTARPKLSKTQKAMLILRALVKLKLGWGR
jgi:squalene synthase HpnC